jgi:DNA-binding GntR family transcriptional regulator
LTETDRSAADGLPAAERPAPPTAAERVVFAIRDGVRDGRYVPGQRLVEADLIRDLGVGRNSVREALSRLSSDGLIAVEPHRGASIRRLSRRDVVQFYQLREVLEGLAARLAASSIDAPGHRDRFTAALEAMRRAAQTEQMPEYVDEDIRFHRAIAELAEHPRLLELVDQLQVQTFRVQFRSSLARDRTGMRGYSTAEHEALAEAILSGDAERAGNLMREHLRHTSDGVMQLPDTDFAS